MTSNQVTIGGTGANLNRIVTINPTANLSRNTAYHVRIPAGAITDRATTPNNYAGITAATTWNFKTTNRTPSSNRVSTTNSAPRDTTAPTISSLTPDNGATGVAVDTDLVLTFNEPVRTGRGAITINPTTGPTVTIPVTDSNQVTVRGRTVTINPGNDLADGVSYHVLVPPGAIQDLAGNHHRGITDPDTWSFAMVDTTAPTISSFTPHNRSTGVAVDTDLVLTFNEPVRTGSGAVTIKPASGATVTIPVTDSNQVMVRDRTVTINPGDDLSGSVSYHVLVSPGAIQDLAGNHHQGITDPDTWSFTMADITAPTISSFIPHNRATGVALDTDLVVTFDEPVRTGSGAVTIKPTRGAAVTIPVTDSDQVMVSGRTVTINPGDDLANGVSYHVLVPPGAIQDLAGNHHQGITDADAWSFTTTGLFSQGAVKAWNARFARTVADQVLDAVQGRMAATTLPGVELNVAGQQLGWIDGERRPTSESPTAARGPAAAPAAGGRHHLLSNASFSLAAPTPGGAMHSFWGRGAVTSFHGQGHHGQPGLNGEVTSLLLGTDWTWGQSLVDSGEAAATNFGLLVSHSRGQGDDAKPADGPHPQGLNAQVRAHLTGVFPWLRRPLSNRLDVWGLAGYGQGQLTVTPQPSDAGGLTADLNLWLAAGGLRGILAAGGNDGLTLTAKGDAMVVGATSAEATGTAGTLQSAQAKVTRLRLGLEAHRPFPLPNSESGAEAGAGATLTPSLEMALRHDGGDAETGFALELGGGFTLSHPVWGLEAELRGRGLLTHVAQGFRDHGFSGSLSWRQRPDSHLGAALSLTQTMGLFPSGGADALLSSVTPEELTANNARGQDHPQNHRLEVQLSYGFPAFGDRFTLTPELGLSLYGSGRDYRMGWNLTPPDAGEPLALSFDLTRQENSDRPEHGVQLKLDTRF